MNAGFVADRTAQYEMAARHDAAALASDPGALRGYETFYNQHRPHQGIANARPVRPLPEPIADPDQVVRLNIRRRDHLGGILHEYEHAA
jgi:hypothetical protein